MARPSEEAIEAFKSITGENDAVALTKLQEHGGDLNAAVNAHFGEEDRSIGPEASVPAPQDDLMEIDDSTEVPPRRNPISALPEATATNPSTILDPNLDRSLFDGGTEVSSRPLVSQPREVRQMPIDVEDGGGEGSGHSINDSIFEDVMGRGNALGPNIRGTNTIANEDDDNGMDLSAQSISRIGRNHDPFGGGSLRTDGRSSAPRFGDLSDDGNDIEEEMVRAAIEASKSEAQEISNSGSQQNHLQLENAELAHVVSLSSQTAEQEKVLREQEGRAPEMGPSNLVASDERMEVGGSSFQNETEDAEEQPLRRNRSRGSSSASMESAKEVGVVDVSPPSSPGRNNVDSPAQYNSNPVSSDAWGGISSEEHDEAVMLEAAMFGGLPEGTGYHFPYASQQFMQSEGPYTRPIPRPPSPSLQAQRLIREQQDDEYLASLAADREKEMKAKEEAEARRLLEEAARKAAVEEEKQKEEEARRKLEEEQELQKLLAAKEASLPQEPAPNEENAVKLLVRMPDGTRHGRRFLKSDRLQSLFDFIDTGRVVKPGTYRLVRPYPRCAFGDGESDLTLNELGLTSKQEAFFLELV